MEISTRVEFKEWQKKILNKAYLVTYISIIYFISVVILMYIVMGNSQAMKTTWIEDILSLTPPIVFILGAHFCTKKATPHFPYAFHKLVSIGFFTAAMSLFMMGAYLLIDGLIKLLSNEHPSIGLITIFGIHLWQGWLMIVTLLWGTIPSLFLGRIKLPLAKQLNDKVLYTDGKMNKDDWLVGIMAVIGVLGIGLGWWWTDALAGILISLNVLHDGFIQLRDAVTELLERSPKNLEGHYIHLAAKVKQVLLQDADISEAVVKLRDQGHVIFGDAYIIPKPHARPLSAARVEELVHAVKQLDWRLKSFTCTICQTIKENA
ncbi:MAG: cation transporter [Gammaproteobacteria bacterium]